MTYASDQLYKGYLRRNMAHFVTIVKVMDILPHLHCLTDSDRDEIVAKRESTGNYNAMQLLLDCLRRREDWPSIFIRALEETEQRNLASELRREYESLLVQHNGPPPPQQPPVTAVANNPPPPYPSPPEYSGPEASPATNQVPAALPAEAASHENTPPKDIAAASVPPPNLAPAPQPDRPSAPSQSLPPQPHSSGAEAHTSLPANLSQALTQHSLLDQSEAKSPVQETDSPDGKVVSTPVKPAEVSQAGINKQHTSPPQESPTQQTSRTSRGTAALDHHNAFPIPSSSGGHSNAKDEFPSKPGMLYSFVDVHVHQAANSRVDISTVREEHPYSGDSNRLQFSGCSSDSIQAPAGPEVASVPEHSRNEPEENHYASYNSSVPCPCQSVLSNNSFIPERKPTEDMANRMSQDSGPTVNNDAEDSLSLSDVRESAMHFYQPPPVDNYAVQTSSTINKRSPETPREHSSSQDLGIENSSSRPHNESPWIAGAINNVDNNYSQVIVSAAVFVCAVLLWRYMKM